MAKISLSEWQIEVANDTHRFKVVCAGRRTGKSVLSRMILLKWATAFQGLYWIVSPTYKQSKLIHWRELKKEVPKSWIEKVNEVELSMTLKNGSIIELKGAENPDALRGVKLRGLIIDEVATIANFKWLWDEVLQATLIDYAAPAIFISTPKGYNHFYDLFLLGKNKEGDYKSWTFTSYDNPFIKPEEIDKFKKDLSEDTFGQEYMAEFKSYTGMVYKQFDRDVHVIPAFDVPWEWTILRGMDFGSTNPTACVWVAVDPDDNWFVRDEYYNVGQTIEHHAQVINSNPLSSRVSQTFGDPSGAQWIKEFSERGVYITPANKDTSTTFSKWVSYGIEKIQERLKIRYGHYVNQLALINQPSIFICENCENLIHEFETYRWREKATTQAPDINEPDVPEKANDHLLDSCRYIAVSYKKRQDVPLNINKFAGYSLQ